MALRLFVHCLTVYAVCLIATANQAVGDEQTIRQFLKSSAIKVTSNGCPKIGGDGRGFPCTGVLYVQGTSFVMHNVKCPGPNAPVVISPTITGNTINAAGMIIALSTDLSRCTVPSLGCAPGYHGNATSCSVEAGYQSSQLDASMSNTPNPKASSRQSASCSDITGTNSKTSAARHCKDANSALTAARLTRTDDPKRSARRYKKAADSYRRAGDTARADAILREAAGQVAVAIAAGASGQVSGASAPPAAGPPAVPVASTPRRMWSGRTEHCEDAGQLERNTAAWYNMCVPFDRAELEKSRPNRYRPPISPETLTARAMEECKDVHWEAKRQCIFDAKLKRLLADDPNVRAECSSRTGKDQIECVDAVFLYGPGAQGKVAERENLRRKLESMPTHLPDLTADAARPQVQSAAGNSCPPGQGMKPTPGAFGGWSCQPLGLIWLAPDRPKPDSSSPPRADPPNAPDPVQAFEERVNHVAAAAVVAVTAATSAQMSAEDRETCTVASFAAVRSTLKGGAPPVPQKCRSMAGAARAELAYYAGAHIDTISNPGVEELLSSLNARSSDSAGLGNNPPSRGAPAADCAQAESHWKAAEDLKLLAIYEDHLARFAACNFAAVAAARIEQLRKR